MKRINHRLPAVLAALCMLFSLAACSAAPGKDAEAEIGAALSGAEHAEKPDGFKSDDLSEAGRKDGADAPATAEPALSPEDSGPADGDDDAGSSTNSQGEALRLTAAEWNDNDNWAFFTNLVNAGTISFPSFGIEPRFRIRVLVTDEAGSPLENEPVTLLEGETALWSARTDKQGVAYVFCDAAQTPDRVISGESEAPVQTAREDSGQNAAVMRSAEDVTLVKAPSAPDLTSMQVLFIVDTTGSMDDELAYLQKDFSAIAGRLGSQDIRYSVSFYRDSGDEYVTRHSDFTDDVAAIQQKINQEYAAGGGDLPEAVAEVLTECLTERTDWSEHSVKLAFLIFDAPPHTGREEALRNAVKAAGEQGIHLIPVVASNADRDTELFGRALAICTNGTYVFLTDDSGVGEAHLEPIVGKYEVELLQDLIVRIIERYRP